MSPPLASTLLKQSTLHRSGSETTPPNSKCFRRLCMAQIRNTFSFQFGMRYVGGKKRSRDANNTTFILHSPELYRSITQVASARDDGGNSYRSTVLISEDSGFSDCSLPPRTEVGAQLSSTVEPLLVCIELVSSQ